MADEHCNLIDLGLEGWEAVAAAQQLLVAAYWQVDVCRQTQSDAPAGKYSQEFCMQLRNVRGIAETEAAGLVFVGGGSVGKRRHKVNRFEPNGL